MLEFLKTQSSDYHLTLSPFTPWVISFSLIASNIICILTALFPFHSGSFLHIGTTMSIWFISLHLSDLFWKLNSFPFPNKPSPGMDSPVSALATPSFPLLRTKHPSISLISCTQSYRIPSYLQNTSWIQLLLTISMVTSLMQASSCWGYVVSFPIPFTLKGWSPFGFQVDPEKCINCPSVTLQSLLISLRGKSKVLEIIDRVHLHLVSCSRPELSTYSPSPTPTYSPVISLASLEFCPPDICVADFPTFFRSSPQGSFFKKDVVDHSTENYNPAPAAFYVPSLVGAYHNLLFHIFRFVVFFSFSLSTLETKSLDGRAFCWFSTVI